MNPTAMTPRPSSAGRALRTNPPRSARLTDISPGRGGSSSGQMSGINRRGPVIGRGSLIQTQTGMPVRPQTGNIRGGGGGAGRGNVGGSRGRGAGSSS